MLGVVVTTPPRSAQSFPPGGQWDVLMVLNIAHPRRYPIRTQNTSPIPLRTWLPYLPVIEKGSDQPGLGFLHFFHTCPLRPCLIFMYKSCHPISKPAPERKQQRRECKETGTERRNSCSATERWTEIQTL